MGAHPTYQFFSWNDTSFVLSNLSIVPTKKTKTPTCQRVFINCDVSWRKRHGENNHERSYVHQSTKNVNQKSHFFFQAFDLHLVGFRTNTFLLLNGFPLLESSDLHHFFPFSFAGWSQVYNWKLKMRRGTMCDAMFFFATKNWCSQKIEILS